MADNKRRTLRPVANSHERKKSLGDKFSEVFFSEDTKTVGETIIYEWVIPGIKNAFIESISMLLFGDRRRGGSVPSGGYHTPYSSYSRGNTYYDSGRHMANVNRGNRFDYTNYDLASLGEVTQVIDEMSDLIREYGAARVSDLNQLIGISGQYTDQKWGWTDCRDFRYRRSGAYYILDFAPPIPLND